MYIHELFLIVISVLGFSGCFGLGCTDLKSQHSAVQINVNLCRLHLCRLQLSDELKTITVSSA